MHDSPHIAINIQQIRWDDKINAKSVTKIYDLLCHLFSSNSNEKYNFRIEYAILTSSYDKLRANH